MLWQLLELLDSKYGEVKIRGDMPTNLVDDFVEEGNFIKVIKQ